MMEIYDDHLHQSNIYARSVNLQDMCLTAIVRDIEFFVHNKTTPQKYIEFLFRVYAEEVLSRHKALNYFIDENAMLCFLNPHLKKVALPGVFRSKRILQQLKVIGFGITSLSLENLRISAKQLNSIVSCMHHVVHLNLKMTSCSDETLACIQKFCPDIQSLIVGYSKVTDCGLKKLCKGNLLLKKLNVVCCAVTVPGIITILDRMPSIECVECDNILSIIYKASTIHGKQYNLTDLDFCNFPNAFDNNLDLKLIEACIKVCPRLKKLHFKCPVSENVLSACVPFKNLDELKIKMSQGCINKTYDALTPILSVAKNLKTLILTSGRISPVKLLENFRSLENLSLKGVSFTQFEKKDIKIPETNLYSLVIKDIHMDDTAVEAITLLISLSKNVTKLYLKNIKHLPPEILDAALKSMKNLTFVNFDFTQVDVQYANLFFEIPSMTRVIMSKNISTVKLFKKGTSCNLSWRNMCDIEFKPYNNKVTENRKNVKKYFYNKNEDVNDETDVISEGEYSCGSHESDMSYYSDSDSSFAGAVTSRELWYSSDMDESDMSAENYYSDADSNDKS